MPVSIGSQQPEAKAGSHAEAAQEGAEQERLVFVNQRYLVVTRGHLKRLESIVGAPDLFWPTVDISSPTRVKSLRNNNHGGARGFSLE